MTVDQVIETFDEFEEDLTFLIKNFGHFEDREISMRNKDDSKEEPLFTWEKGFYILTEKQKEDIAKFLEHKLVPAEDRGKVITVRSYDTYLIPKFKPFFIYIFLTKLLLHLNNTHIFTIVHILSHIEPTLKASYHFQCSTFITAVLVHEWGLRIFMKIYQFADRKKAMEYIEQQEKEALENNEIEFDL